MKFTTLLTTALTALPILADSSFPWERLNKNDSLLIIVDLQEGLYNLARDYGMFPPFPPSPSHTLY